jgi:hypothetical protein
LGGGGKKQVANNKTLEQKAMLDKYFGENKTNLEQQLVARKIETFDSITKYIS